jgi:hypothetical protein
MGVGLMMFLVGAGSAFYYPSRPFTIPWLLMIIGWALGMIGVGIYAYTFFRFLKTKGETKEDLHL